MYHPSHIQRPSAIVAATSVFGPVLGELPDSVLRWMALPEPVKVVQVDNRVMFHWAAHGQNQNDFRSDTGTYQWVAESARASSLIRTREMLAIKPELISLSGGWRRRVPNIKAFAFSGSS
jgi:hypothetical protein